MKFNYLEPSLEGLGEECLKLEITVIELELTDPLHELDNFQDEYLLKESELQQAQEQEDLSQMFQTRIP
jgi:hypothetical protein